MLKAISNMLPRLTTRTGIAQWLLALMFFANVAPMFRGQSYEENYLIDQVARQGQMVGLGSLMLAALLTCDLRLSQNKAFMLITGPFTTYLLVNVMFSDAPATSAWYAFLFFVTATSVGVIRLKADDWLLVFRLAALGLSGALLIFVLIKTREGRYWGAVHPNAMGTWILVTAILATAWRNWFRWLVLALTVYVGVMVDSRFSVLGMLLLFVSSLFFNNLHMPRKALLGSLAIVIAGLVFWQVGSSFFLGQGDRSFEGGGISGRDVLWEEAFERISNHPFLGSGFRTSTASTIGEEDGAGPSGAHSGLIAAADELGFIGLLCFLGMFVWRALDLFRGLKTFDDPSLQRLYALLLAGLVADLSPLMFQPNYINFGDPLGLFVMLALFSNIRVRQQNSTRYRYDGDVLLKPRFLRADRHAR